ncbi:hypothetical protein BDW59DRAFT_148059 [Aspergillus cavernicola]|uniref:Amino acid permease/ SLC12A domain-containing protein n=1 Tax=Aspergillus cavernicola TaxID=176166 RepID=A0ABR4I8D5_9EURO
MLSPPTPHQPVSTAELYTEESHEPRVHTMPSTNQFQCLVTLLGFQGMVSIPGALGGNAGTFLCLFHNKRHRPPKMLLFTFAHHVRVCRSPLCSCLAGKCTITTFANLVPTWTTEPK